MRAPCPTILSYGGNNLRCASVRFFPPPSPRARLLHAARLHAADRLLRATEPPWRALLAQATLPWS